MQSTKVNVNRPTGRFIRITKSTGRGSDYFGLCEICSKHMSECFRSSLKRERKRATDGSLYLDDSQPVIYAHESCISKYASTDPAPSVTCSASHRPRC